MSSVFIQIDFSKLTTKICSILINRLRVLSVTYGFIVEVDLDYPKELLDTHIAYPFAPAIESVRINECTGCYEEQKNCSKI